MILLALDTALAACSACIYDSTKNEILASERGLMERGHAEALPPMVARVMAQSKLAYKDLSRIAVTIGPGTFTGIRVGLGFSRALGVSLKIKVVGVDTATALRFADAKDGLTSASGFAAYAASLPDPEAMPHPLYMRDADAKPQTTKLRGLPQLQIHVADAADLPVLASLHALCFEEAWDEKAILGVLSGPGCVALLATSAEGPVGMMIYRAVADEAEILTLGVDPNLRGRGVGMALVEGLKSLHIPALFLEVASRNEDAIKLYSKAGFEQKGLRKAYYATGDDALILRFDHR
jgi:ribosomal protein S18 acetylase RimI-like enzyme